LAPSIADLYQSPPREWFTQHGLWCGHRVYDDMTKRWLAASGHYLAAPPPGALLAVSLETLTAGLFGHVPSGDLRGLALLGRPVARTLPQDGSVAEVTRLVLAPGLPRETASHMLMVAVEMLERIVPRSVAVISYHDRTRHTGCIYRKAGFRKDGVTRPGTRRGSWSTRGGREQAASSELESKRRWRIDLGEVRQAIAGRADPAPSPR